MVNIAWCSWIFGVNEICSLRTKSQQVPNYSRCECIVLLCSEVVGVEVKHANHKGHKHHNEDHHELKDVFDSPAQRDLEGAKALIGWKDVGNSREAQHNSNGIQTLWDQLGVRRHPVEACCIGNKSLVSEMQSLQKCQNCQIWKMQVRSYLCSKEDVPNMTYLFFKSLGLWDNPVFLKV